MMPWEKEEVAALVKVAMPETFRAEVRVEVAELKFPTPCTENKEPGVVVPIPTLPEPRMSKSVALVFEATAKRAVDAEPAVVEETESWAHGVVVPMPIAEVVAEEPTLCAWVKASYEVSAESVSVIGEGPITVNALQESAPEQETEVVAIEPSFAG